VFRLPPENIMSYEFVPHPNKGYQLKVTYRYFLPEGWISTRVFLECICPIGKITKKEQYEALEEAAKEISRMAVEPIRQVIERTFTSQWQEAVDKVIGGFLSRKGVPEILIPKWTEVRVMSLGSASLMEIEQERVGRLDLSALMWLTKELPVKRPLPSKYLGKVVSAVFEFGYKLDFAWRITDDEGDCIALGMLFLEHFPDLAFPPLRDEILQGMEGEWRDVIARLEERIKTMCESLWNNEELREILRSFSEKLREKGMVAAPTDLPLSIKVECRKEFAFAHYPRVEEVTKIVDLSMLSPEVVEKMKETLSSGRIETFITLAWFVFPDERWVRIPFLYNLWAQEVGKN